MIGNIVETIWKITNILHNFSKIMKIYKINLKIISNFFIYLYYIIKKIELLNYKIYLNSIKIFRNRPNI